MARGVAGSSAINNPVSPQYGKEVHSEDLPLRQLADLGEEREPEIILSSESMAEKDYLDELAFMEEEVVVLLNRGREKFAPKHEMFGVNGQTLWVIVGVPTKLKRKFVEVMARSQPMDVRTNSGEEATDAMTFNRTERSLSSNFSFSILKDPNPKGAAWLEKVMRES